MGSPDRENDRFTPTPRRSIHSYKVTETSKQTTVRTPDGNVKRDFSYKKITSDGMFEDGSTAQAIIRTLPKVFLAAILVAAGYFLYQVGTCESAI